MTDDERERERLERIECGECIQHGRLSLKVEQICKWREGHERECREAGLKVTGLEMLIERKFSTMKSWAIGNLVAIIVFLITMVVDFIKK